MDTKGQLFTIDALLALILLTVMIGVSANTMDIVGNKILEYSSEQSIQRIGGDTVDVLIKTPGVPEDWENSKYFTSITPGLADTENRNKFGNMLDMKEISSLRKNPNLIKQFLPAGMCVV